MGACLQTEETGSSPGVPIPSLLSATQYLWVFYCQWLSVCNSEVNLLLIALSHKSRPMAVFFQSLVTVLSCNFSHIFASVSSQIVIVCSCGKQLPPVRESPFFHIPFCYSVHTVTCMHTHNT